jgi:hypothetical protein
MNYIGPKIERDIELAKLQGTPEHELRLCVDWDQRTVDVESRLVSDGAHTVVEHYDHSWSITIPLLTADDYHAMLEAVRLICDEVCDAYPGGSRGEQCKWEDMDWYHTQLHRAERVVEDAPVTAPGGLWSAFDWFQAAPPATKEELQDCLAEASSDGVWLYDLEDYIEQEMG